MRIGLVQINNGYSGQYYLPYSVGMLEAYARKHLSRPHDYEFLLPVYRRDPVEEAVAQLLSADIVGFSTYVWNAQLTYRIAAELKRRKPEVITVFGGPQVPDKAEGFLRKYPFVDIATHGEAEKTFTAILEDPERVAEIPSVSFLRNGEFTFTGRAGRLSDLDELPSPYLDEVFQRLLVSNPGAKWNAIFETNRGCPFKCTFCDWGSATGDKVKKMGMERISAEIEWFGRNRIEFIFCADANFGILPRDIEIAETLAKVKRATGLPRGFSTSNTKNSTERSFAAQKILSEAGLNAGVSVSMQSMAPQVLIDIKRDNIKIEGPNGFRELQRKFTLAGIETSTDIVLALPGETYDSFVRGVDELIAGGQHNRILFYNLTVLPNAEMGDPAYQERYGMDIVPTRIITIHGNLNDREDAVPEMQQLVVGTNAMPRADWVRVRAFSWMTALLHFDKVMQIPLVVAHELFGARYRDMIELFSEGRFDPAEFPTLARVREFFVEKARSIQAGGEDFCRAPQWLDVWWPADEYMLIDLATSGRLGDFYAEALRALSGSLGFAEGGREHRILREAVHLNERMLKMPFVREDRSIELSGNIWEFYQAAVRNQPVPFREEATRHVIDCTSEQWDSWDAWCRFVVWYSSKRGAYLFGSKPGTALVTPGVGREN
jgi:radical SAM superfamily enzyme YgiQ (UPF0313 family)